MTKLNSYLQFFAIVFILVICSIGNMPMKIKKPECKNIKVTGRIKEYGLARGDVAKMQVDKKTPTKTSTNFKNIIIIQKTNRIPARVGNLMYFSFELSNLPEDDFVKGLNIQTSFPQMINPQGEKFNSFVRNYDTVKNKYDTTLELEYYWSFQKEFPFEMVEGNWTFQILYKDCELTRIEFYSYL